MQIIAYFVLFCHYGDFVENLFSSPKRRYQRRRESRCFLGFFCFFLLTSTFTSVNAHSPASSGNPRTAGIWGLFSAYQRRTLTCKHFCCWFWGRFLFFCCRFSVLVKQKTAVLSLWEFRRMRVFFLTFFWSAHLRHSPLWAAFLVPFPAIALERHHGADRGRYGFPAKNRFPTLTKMIDQKTIFYRLPTALLSCELKELEPHSFIRPTFWYNLFVLHYCKLLLM